MNKQHTTLNYLMTSEEKAKLHCLEERKTEVRQFQKRIYDRECSERNVGQLRTFTSSIVFTILIFAALLCLTSNVFVLVPATLLLSAIFHYVFSKILNKRQSWQTLFMEGIQDYSQRALNQSALQCLKNAVQSTGKLDFHYVKTWFDEELFSAHVRINDLYARYQYAWFYQNQEPFENCGLDAREVAAQCSAVIDLNEMNRIRNESGK